MRFDLVVIPPPSPEHRRNGLGKELVAAVTRAVLDRGKVPLYTTWAANIPSRGVCIGVGYRPAWLEIYAIEPVPTPSS